MPGGDKDLMGCASLSTPLDLLLAEVVKQQYVVYGPGVPEVQDGVRVSNMGLVPLSTIVAFEPMGSGVILVGVVNGSSDDGSTLQVWVGDVTFEVEFPALMVFRYAGNAAADAGLLVGKQFNSWLALANAWEAVGSPIDLGEIE